jgi:hypothetical protein
MPSMMNIHLVLGQHATLMVGDFLPPTTITCNAIHLRNRESKQLVCVSDVIPHRTSKLTPPNAPAMIDAVKNNVIRHCSL